MRLENLEDWQQEDINRRILKGHGEVMSITYTDLVEEPVVPETADTRTTGPLQARLVPVQVTRQYYVGRMSAGQTGDIVAILAVLLVRGMQLKDILGTKNNLAFLEILDEHHLTLFMATVLGEKQAWVQENWALEWVVEAAGLFFKYNDFFGVMQRVMALAEKWGLTEEKVKALALGTPAS